MDQPIEKSGDSAAADGPSTSFDGTSTSFDGPSTIFQSTGKCISKTTEQDGGEREEIVKLWRQMDEKLEHKAKSHNLSAVNVKTILHHLIKNPGVISLIMGIDDNASLPDLKLTRSKVKQLCKKSDEAESNGASRETEVVVVPRAERTFLNVDYGHNEDDDEDYNPDLDEADAGSEAEGEVEIDDNETNLDDSSSSLQVVEERETDQPALHTRSRYPNTDTTADDEPLCGDDVLLFSTVDDPDYVDFISTLNDPSRYEADEAEDPEYNFMRDLEYEEIPERDELRMDRGTEIPMREVENLLQDLIDSGLTNTQSEAEQTINAEVSKHTREESAHKHIKRPSSASRRFCEQQFTDHVTVLMGANVDDLAKLSPESACLDGISIEKPPKFTAFEIEQLRIQLTKHVQLLTQFMVGCHFEPTLFDVRNEYQKMINELYEHSSNNASTSIFNIRNLEASIVTCHDAINCERVEFPELDEHHSRYKRLNLPLPQTMLVLARSRALLYPELMPAVRLRKFPSFYQYFTVPEESLLAMGQYMFSHIAHSTAAKRDGRNALIVRYFLPNKEVSQIRLHMKNFRLSPEPIYTVIARAEQGMVTMIFPPEKSDSAQSGPPYLWRESIQPHWLQMLDKRVFHEPESTAFDEVIRQDTASPDGLIIRQLPESGLTTPCHSSPTAVSETCEEGEDEAGMMEMSVIGRDHSERQQRTVSNTLAEEEKDRNERVKWSRGTEVDGNMMENMKGDEVLGRKGILELKAEHIRRKSELRKRKELSESPVKGCERKKHKELIRASEDGEDCSCAEQVGSESDGQVQKEANGSELQTVKDDQRGNISKPFELVNESSVNKKATERTELMHGKEAVQTNNGEVQNNRSDHIVCSSNESEIPAAQPANSASGMPAAFQVVQAAVPLSATSESLTSAFRAVDGSCSSVPPSCQVIFVPVMPNVSWIVLTQPSVGGQQILLGPSATQTVQTAGPVGENSINSDGTSAVGNAKGSVMSTLNAPDAVEVERSCEPRTEAANVVDVSDRSLDDRIVAAKGNTEETLVTSNTVQRNCIVEQGCTVSAVDDSVIVQAADVAESVDSNVEKNSLKSGTAASTGSLLECHPYSNTGAFQTEHDHKLLTEGSNICQTSPHSSQATLRTSEHIESAAKASTVVEDMPDVDAGIATEGDQCFTSDAIPQPITVQHLPFNSVTVSPVESAENSSFTFCAVSPAEKGQHSSCSFGAVSPAESSLVSPKSPMNNLLTLERDRGLSSPEDSNSGLTVLFTERSRTALNIHEGTPPPPTPSWQHSSGMAFIDDSASKTRFTDGEGSQAEWRRDGWTPRTPGQPVKPVEGESRKLSKAKKALFTSDGSMKSESPEKVDFGVQWEPLDVTSDHEPRSSNSSLGDASHEDRSSGSAIQHDSESITHENLELMKDVEGAGGDRGQESRHSTEEPRCRKRKRKERLRDGLRGMLNEDHRARQMRALSRVVLGDFKQRMFMHQHKIRSIQQLISSQPPSQQVFEKLKEILGSEHDLLLVLVSFLFPDDMLPEAILNDPLRKAYASAIEMLLNIEAYATFGRSKFSARSIFRSVRELGPFCTSEELQARLYEVVGGERPLWSALSAYLPSAAHPQTHQTYEYECVDTASWDEADAEWEDVDVSCLLKSDAERRRKPAVIVNGKLLVEKKGKLCEAVACFKCEEAANAEGRPQTDDETVAVDEIVKETDADTSEVEILDVEDCITLVDEKTVSRDGAVENISRSKRMHGNITGEEAGNADEWGEAENVAKKDDTMVTSLNMDVNESNEMEGSKTVGSMGTKCTLNGEIIGSSEKLFIKEQIHKEKKKESSYNKISRRKVEKDEAKRYSDKQETFTEKWLESNSEVKTSKNLCRRSHLGEVSTNGKEITAEGKKTREKNDAKEDEIRDKDRPNFSKVSECANFVKMGSDDPISKETSPSAKEVEEPSSKSNYNAADGLQMDLVPESGSERVLMTNNGRGENTTKFKRSAEIANKDGSLLGASRKKISRGSSEEQFSEERRAMGRLSMAFECSQRNGDEMTGFQLYGQRCPATENGRRSSEPDLSPVKRLDGQNPRASLRSEYNRQLSSSYHPSRQRRSRSGSADNDCSHWRRDLKGRSTVHRSEHGSRFGRWHKEKGDRCYQEELSIHDQYGQVRRRDPDRREMWSKCSKYEREGALRSRRGTPRTNPERSTYQRHSSGRSQRFSSECDHKVSPNMRIERYDMPKFDRMEGRREKRRRDRQQWNDRRDESHLQRGGKKTLVTENRENPKGCYERTKDSRSPGSDFEGDGSRKSFIKRSEKCLRSFSNSRCERSHITSKQRPYGSRDSEPEEAPIKRMRVELTSSVSSADHDERPTVCCSTLDRRLTEQIELEPGELISDESFSGLEDVVLMTQEQPETEPNLSTKRERAFEKMDWGEIVDGSCRQTPTCSSDRGITKTSYTEREACSGIDGNIHKQQCSVSRCESRSLPKNSCDEQSEGGSLAFEEVSKRFKRNWSREDDGQLLHAYNEFDGDIEKVVCAFAQSVHLNDLQEVRERLLFLLSFFN